MSVIDSLKYLSANVKQFLRRVLTGESKFKNLQYMLAEVEAWQPNGQSYGYKTEMENRVLYLSGSMRKDMLAILKDEFSSTWEEMQNNILNFKIVSNIILERAQVFPDGTVFALRDRKTKKPVDSDSVEAVRFQNMIEDGNFLTMFQNIDALTQLCQRSAAKFWWDKLAGCVKVSAYPPNMVHIVPDPNKYWDAYSAINVLFQRPGADGVRSKRPRYEVWASNEGSIHVNDLGLPEFEIVTHYVTDGYEDTPVNKDNVNPFKDPFTDRHIVPFTWFKSDTEDSIYAFGAEDLLTPNRIINWGMTALHHNLIWQSFGIPTWEVEEGKKVNIPSTAIVSPRHAMQIPPGVKFSFQSPDLDVTEPLSFYEAVFALDASLNSIDPKVITFTKQADAPASGYSLKVRMHKLLRWIKKMRPIYAPDVVHALTTAIIVLNYYMPKEGIDLQKYEPYWIPADPSVPVDMQEDNLNHQTLVSNNQETYADWFASRNKVDLETAKKQVEEIAEYNSQFKASTLGDPEQLAQDAAAEIFSEEKTDEPAPAPDADGDTTGMQDLNVYQMAKMIEHNAASAVDMRMKSFGEDEATAKRRVQENIKVNLEMARIQGQQKGIEEAELMAAAPAPDSPAPAPGNKPPIPGEPADEEPDEEPAEE